MVAKEQIFEVELEEGMVSEPSVGILDGETAKGLAEYLHEELEAAENERSGQKEQWKKWRRQREMRPEEDKVDYPWPKGANVAVPAAGMLTQNMYAYVKSTFTVRDPLVSVQSYTKDSRDIEVADTLERYLDLIVESPFDLNLREKARTITYESNSMGTVFVKVPWTSDRWVFRGEDEGTGEDVEVESFLHDGPEWVAIPREDFLYREYVQDIQRAPWVAHHFTLTEHELHNRGADGRYSFIEEVKKHYRSEEEGHRIEDDMRRGISWQPAKIYDLYETYVFWKLEDSPYMIDLLVTYHRESNRIIRAEYNKMGIRPVGAVGYIPRPFCLDSIGIGWICEHMQDEIDFHHRSRLNNAHFAGLKMLAIKRGSGIKASEKVYPGKIWKLDDPTKDIMPIDGGSMDPSSLQSEQMALMYMERGVGFSDAQRGAADMVAKSGTSAQLQMFNAQQGGKLINSITEGMVDSWSMLSMFTVFQLVLNKKRVLANEKLAGRLDERELENLERALNIRLQDIPRKLKFSVRTTDMDKTFESRKQNTVSLVQIYTMFWEKIIPMLGQMSSPQLPEPVKMAMGKAFTGSCRLMEKVFKFFGEDDTGKFIPEYEKMEILLEIQDAMSGDIMGARKMLEEMREKGQGNIGRAGIGTQAVAGGQGRVAGNANQPGMGAPVQGVQPPAGAAGPIA